MRGKEKDGLRAVRGTEKDGGCVAHHERERHWGGGSAGVSDGALLQRLSYIKGGKHETMVFVFQLPKFYLMYYSYFSGFLIRIFSPS